MNREKMIAEMQRSADDWDIIIIGGGATGLGSAVDSASRGYKTLLIEQSDFSKGTSSRSTKLIHGGLRYLQQGNITLVIEALKERGVLCQNAPHLIHHLPFLVPNYRFWEGPFYGVGLKIYDMLAGELGIEKSKHLSREETLQEIPTLEPKNLRGGTVYYDGQFDDSRLAICLAQTAIDQGAVVLNYMKMTGLIKKNGLCCGVELVDQENQNSYTVHGRCILNATGVFSDEILKKDDPKAKSIIAPSQGIHLVLDKTFQPGNTAILVPHTPDKRVLFIVPWHDKVLLGTTDTPISKATLEPKPLEKEIDFLLSTARHYLTKAPSYKDILSVFAGLRPLIKMGNKNNTAALSRDHTIVVSQSGLITIAGGKWTTYRKMAEDVINQAIVIGGLQPYPCRTTTLKLHGWTPDLNPKDVLSTYGSAIQKVTSMDSQTKPFHPHFPYLKAEIVWSIRNEMARTVEDVLARRLRCLLLDAKASIEVAPMVAEILAQELGKDTNWKNSQIEQYNILAKNYMVN